MKLKCKKCGKSFFGKNATYCSMECYKNIKKDLDDKIKSSVLTHPKKN